MMQAKPIATKSEDLTVEEALKYLQSPSAKPSCVPPVKPKGGEIFLYSAGDNPSKSGKNSLKVTVKPYVVE